MRDEEGSWERMDATDVLSPTPVSDIEEEDETRKDGVHCDDCGERLTDEAYWDSDSDCYCELCANQLVEKTKIEAESYAREHCKITCQPPTYDLVYETPNALAALCRHEYTNYDELIKDLDRDGITGRIYYKAIRLVIEELLDDVIDKMADDESEDDADIEGDE